MSQDVASACHAALEALSQKIGRIIPHSWTPKPKTSTVSPKKPTPAVEVLQHQPELVASACSVALCAQSSQ